MTTSARAWSPSRTVDPTGLPARVSGSPICGKLGSPGGPPFSSPSSYSGETHSESVAEGKWILTCPFSSSILILFLLLFPFRRGLLTLNTCFNLLCLQNPLLPSHVHCQPLPCFSPLYHRSSSKTCLFPHPTNLPLSPSSLDSIHCRRHQKPLVLQTLDPFRASSFWLSATTLSWHLSGTHGGSFGGFCPRAPFYSTVSPRPMSIISSL